MKLKTIINDIIKNGFYSSDGKLIIVGENKKATLAENMQLQDLLIFCDIEKIKEQFGDIELEKVSDNEYKEVGLD